MSASFRVLLPVQASGLAMPRCELTQPQRGRLATAFAEDTLDAARRCRSVRTVVVVSPDPNVQALADAHDAAFVLASPSENLNAALDRARLETAEGNEQMIATIASDLPALTTDELEGVLTYAGRRQGAVHAKDTGDAKVTFYAERPITFEACMVADLTRRHTPRGDPLRPAPPGLMCDVDNLAGLRVAAYLGLGPATRRAIDELGAHLLRPERAFDFS